MPDPVAEVQKNPTQEALDGWLEEPKGYLGFFKQRRAIMINPGSIPNGTGNPGWSGPLKYSLKGMAILCLVAQAFSWLLYVLSSQNILSVPRIEDRLKQTTEANDLQVAKLQQNLDDVRNSPSDTEFNFPDLPEALSQDDAIAKLNTEISNISSKNTQLRNSLELSKWEDRLDVAWKSVMLPATMILASLYCRRKIRKFIPSPKVTVDSAYLYLSTSHSLFPNALGACALMLLGLAMQSSNPPWFYFVLLPISGIWYWYSLAVVGDRLTDLLGVSDAAGRKKVIASVTSANVILVCASQLAFKVFTTLTNSIASPLN